MAPTYASFFLTGCAPLRNTAAARTFQQFRWQDLPGCTEERDYEGIPIRTGGDIIVAIDGRKVGTAEDVVREVSELLPGRRVVFTVVRDRERVNVAVELGDRPSFVPGEN